MKPSGLSVPIPTLFADDGALDTGKNAKFARTLSEAKVDHLFALGSLGEFPLVDDPERARLLENVIESAIGPTDVWVGCGAPSTRRAVAYAEEAEGLGAGAVVAVPPYYLHPTLPAIERYYRAIRAAVSVPVLAYNIPSLVGYALPPALVHRLGQEGVVAGVKDTAGSIDSVAGFLSGAPTDFAVMPGDDALVAEAIRRGASGGVMGMANLVPRLCVELVRAARAGETERATECQTLVNELVAVSHAAPFPSVDKFLAAELWGADVGYRSPYDPLSPEEADAVRTRLEPLKPRLAPFLRK
ncbi:MAG TPA: dihydrodipicolinate synthase family protein [Thermoplasmata archaeon]|nr:dihydrodipicolinate synthase family protein [Thermoplasmata archaeon]